jgi:hypothetical protein
MAGRGSTTFQKRQKELQRKERQQQKFEKRLERKKNPTAEDPAEPGEQPDAAETGSAPDPKNP